MSMYKLFPAGAILALAFPLSLLADLTGSTTLPANSTFNLNAGDTPGCAGDIVWAGGYLGPQGSAGMFVVPGTGGSVEFQSLTLSALQPLAYGQTGISSPAVNDVFAVKTNAGSYAKVLVTALTGTSITLQYQTYGVTAGAPVVLQALNNYSYSNTIAQGSLFVITGCGLAAQGSKAVLQDPTQGLPLTLNGASVSVTVNGTAVPAPLYYATATQIAGVLPSTAPAGTGYFSVQYLNQPGNSASALVANTAFGLGSLYATGSGPGLATDINYQLVTPTHSAIPGQAITLWGSGLGASPQDSDSVYATAPHAISVSGLPLQVLIGGIPAQILYQGRSGYPGLDQVNVVVPAGVATGCAVSVVAVNSNYQILSNFVTLPVAVGGGACTDPILAIGPQQLASLAAKSSVNVGLVAVQQYGTPGAAQADFFTIPGSSLGAWLAGQYQNFTMGLSPLVSRGSCVAASGTPVLLPPPFPALDAGAMTFSGPAGQRALPVFASTPGEYFLDLAVQDGLWNPLTGGTYTFSAAGGKDVGAFTAALNFPIQETFAALQPGLPPIQISATGQTITWTGGAAGEFVTISGASQFASFACNVDAAAGQFTIPPYVLTPLRNPGVIGTLSVQVSTYPQPVTASGLDAAFGFGYVIPQTVNVVYY